MNVEYLIQLLTNKMTVLANAKIQAYNAGDLVSVNSLEEEMLSTQNTLSKLRLLLTIDTAALSVNTTPADIVSSGIESVQAPTVQGPSASALINGFDVSAYATDELYEQKIWAILGSIPTFSSIWDIDTYIQTRAEGSPVTGAMIYAAVQQYSVDLPLTIAIMQNDSAFGTLGIGATTYNPGNIGNTGSATRSYGSWAEGVSAVAEWLSKHRIAGVPIVPPPVLLTVIPVEPLAPIIPPAEPIKFVKQQDPVVEEPVIPTPVQNPATTTPIIDTGTSTPPIVIDSVSTTTPSVEMGTSTPPIVDMTSTTTPTFVPPSDSSASTTPESQSPDSSGGVVSPPEVLDQTIPPTSTSTQAFRKLNVKKRV